MKKYEAILFDLGNVLFRIHFNKCFELWAKASNTTVEEVSKLFAFDEAYTAHEVAKITGEEYHTHICKLLNVSLAYEDFVKGWNTIFGEVIKETQDLLLELKGSYKLYALTNSNILHRKVWSVRYDEVLKNFDQIFCSSQIGHRKPDHKSFELVCQRTSIHQSQFIFIDDLLENVKGAVSFGMKAILFANPVETCTEIRLALIV